MNIVKPVAFAAMISMLAAASALPAEAGVGMVLNSKKGLPRIVVLGFELGNKCKDGRLAATMDAKNQTTQGCLLLSDLEETKEGKTNGYLRIYWDDYGPRMYDLGEWTLGYLDADDGKALGAP